MSRNIGIVVAALLLLGLGGFIVFSQQSSFSFKNGSTTTEQTSGNSPESGEKSIKDLFASGASQRCTFNNPDSKESGGTVYVSDGKVRGDFTVLVSDKNVTTHMISDGTTSYIWTEGQTTGFKMAFEGEESNPNSLAQSNGGVDFNTKMNYNCSAWNEDPFLFVVPTSVTFTWLTGAKVGTTTESTMKAEQCSACDNIPPSGRDQCKKTLGC